MKDIFGNDKPVQIELNEWWFNGRIIVNQDDFRLSSWISFADSEHCVNATVHSTRAKAVKCVLENPFVDPQNLPEDYI
jgi:hypothetical protein